MWILVLMAVIRAQPAQEVFLSSPADIAIYGGAAGGGKSYAALLEALRHVNNPGFRAVIFRRHLVEHMGPGALWDEAMALYTQPPINGVANRATNVWTFPSGAKVSFEHLEYENTVFAKQGMQYALIIFEELTHFTAKQFWYMLSRNRSTCGVRPYVRATCNPDPDSFVRELVAWYLDDEGFAIPSRSGVLRFFLRRGDRLIWADSRQELAEQFPDAEPLIDIKSFTFVKASVYDNEILLTADPAYLGNLKALHTIERERLLRGNWKIKPSAGMYFPRAAARIIDVAPPSCFKVRFWDRAATEPNNEYPDPDWTAGVLMSRTEREFPLEDLRHERLAPSGVEALILQTAEMDGPNVLIGLEQEPGASGKAEAQYLARKLAGFNVRILPASVKKTVRAGPPSTQWKAGNMPMVRGSWNPVLIDEGDAFPEGPHDDIEDGISGAFQLLTEQQEPMLVAL